MICEFQIRPKNKNSPSTIGGATIRSKVLFFVFSVTKKKEVKSIASNFPNTKNSMYANVRHVNYVLEREKERENHKIASTWRKSNGLRNLENPTLQINDDTPQITNSRQQFTPILDLWSITQGFKYCIAAILRPTRVSPIPNRVKNSALTLLQLKQFNTLNKDQYKAH